MYFIHIFQEVTVDRG